MASLSAAQAQVVELEGQVKAATDATAAAVEAAATAAQEAEQAALAAALEEQAAAFQEQFGVQIAKKVKKIMGDLFKQVKGSFPDGASHSSAEVQKALKEILVAATQKYS